MNRKDPLAAPLPSLILAIVGALLTIPASFAVWEQREILDQGRFVALGNEALSRQAVQDELAQSLSDDLAVVRDPGLESSISELLGDTGGTLTTLLDVIGGRRGSSASVAGDDKGLLTTAAGKVIAAAPNTIATDLALAATHAEVVEAIRNEVLSTDGSLIVLNLNGAVSQLLPVQGVLLPETAGSVEVMDDNEMSFGLRAARFLDGRAVWLSLLCVAVFGMGFFLAADARRYALQAGVALLITAAVTAVAVRFVMRERIVSDAIDQERSRPAANAVYDVFTSGLLTQELAIAVVGLLLAAAGFLLLRSSAESAT